MKTIRVRWEGEDADVATVEVTHHSTLDTLHAALASFEPLKQKEYTFMFQQKPVPRDNWKAMQVDLLEDVVQLRLISSDFDMTAGTKTLTRKLTGGKKKKKRNAVPAITKKAYSKQGHRRLNFEKGVELIVLKQVEDSAWWWCELDGVKGYAPKKYLRLMEDTLDMTSAMLGETLEEEVLLPAPNMEDTMMATMPVAEDSDSDDDAGYAAPTKATEEAEAAAAVPKPTAATYEIPENIIDHLEGILSDAIAEESGDSKSDSESDSEDEAQAIPKAKKVLRPKAKQMERTLSPPMSPPSDSDPMSPPPIPDEDVLPPPIPDEDVLPPPLPEDDGALPPPLPEDDGALPPPLPEDDALPPPIPNEEVTPVPSPEADVALPAAPSDPAPGPPVEPEKVKEDAKAKAQRFQRRGSRKLKDADLAELPHPE